MKIKSILFILGIGLLSGCANFLDVVPDDVPTIDHAFRDRVSAERYLFTCYNYLPDHASPNRNPAFIGGDENVILYNTIMGYIGEDWPYYMPRGLQNVNSPVVNFWDGEKGGKSMFQALRDCNIFLENIHKPVDLQNYERTRWVAEVKFLKAYYHFWLLQLYGPIPVIDKNIPVNATPEEVRIYRQPIDTVVNYIVKLLDEAYEDLPLEIQSQTSEMGRITQPIALAVKAKVLVWAASPLFNGNSDYAHVKDNRGVELFPQSYDKKKWEKAAEACLEAIEVSEAAGHELYYFENLRQLSDSIVVQMNLRGAVTDRWNKEIIWGATTDCGHLQCVSMPRLKGDEVNITSIISEMAPALRIAEQFYSEHGLPIDEDRDYDYINRYKTQIAGQQDRYYIQEGRETAKLNFNREPRFYASLAFDGAMWYGAGKLDDKEMRHLEAKRGEYSGVGGVDRYSTTGYFGKKLVHWETEAINTSTLSVKRYAFPIIRLADLYLLYAEAQTEASETVDPQVYRYIDDVRKRSGLKGVVETWSKYSKSNPDKPTTKKGLLEIIQQERLNELALEGQRFWDLRRWKKMEYYMNKPFRGWNVKGEDVVDYYRIVTYLNPEFGRKDYLWPLKQEVIDRNENMLQNPGWY